MREASLVEDVQDVIFKLVVAEALELTAVGTALFHISITVLRTVFHLGQNGHYLIFWLAAFLHA
jgi:hypothetical protein